VASKYAQQSDVETDQSRASDVSAGRTFHSNDRGQFFNRSRSKAVADVRDGGHGSQVFDGGSSSADSGKKATDKHLQRQEFGGGGNTPVGKYRQSEISTNSAKQDPVDKSATPTESEPQGSQVLTSGRVSENENSGDDERKPWNGETRSDGVKPVGDGSVAEKGQLLLSAMVDKDELPEHAENNPAGRYPDVRSESGRKPAAPEVSDGVDTYSNDGGIYLYGVVYTNTGHYVFYTVSQ